eukprot:TRINITY_DN8706_c0_g1_i2.p2 TRINITY_DN8706_c0_g1~~TRINITY_DN8706_c0_g1_i2.p2  ORF type:complete len:217 (+),score=40.75 TRINITY_DN8706_c0_g1_i2:491-1141(+)
MLKISLKTKKNESSLSLSQPNQQQLEKKSLVLANEKPQEIIQQEPNSMEKSNSIAANNNANNSNMQGVIQQGTNNISGSDNQQIKSVSSTTQQLVQKSNKNQLNNMSVQNKQEYNVEQGKQQQQLIQSQLPNSQISGQSNDKIGSLHLAENSKVQDNDNTRYSGSDNLQEIGRAVSYTHLRAHETRHDLVCRLLLEKKKKKNKKIKQLINSNNQII